MEQAMTHFSGAGYTAAAVVYEILFAAVLLFMLIRGIRRGLLSSLLDLAGVAVSVIGGAWAAGTFAPVLYENYIGVALGERVSEQVLEHGRELAEALKSIPFLPASLETTLQGILESAGSEAVPQLVAAMEPVVLPLVQCLLFLPTFLLLRLLINLLAKVLTGANRLPLVGGLNSALGGVIGLAAGALDGWALAWVLWLAAGATDGAWEFLTVPVLQQSFFWRLFASFNPFIAL